MLQNSETIANNSRIRRKQTLNANQKQIRMSDVTDVYDGQIRIYRTTHSGDVYQLRMWVSQERKYIRKSLKTRDKTQAIQLAQKEFIRYQAKLLNGEKLFSLTADELRTKYLEHIQKEVDGNQLSKGRQTNVKTFTKHYLEFVGKNARIQSIEKRFFIGYREFRQSRLKTITMTVVQNESITIKQMYKWAIENGFLEAIYLPDFGTIRVKKDEVRRESFTIRDYNSLIDVAKKWYTKVPQDHVKRDEEIYYRRTIRDFIVLMANFGFRTGELFLTKFEDVVVHNDATATVNILRENTKVRKARSVRGRRGDVFSRRLAYSTYKEPGNYVFSHFKEEKLITKELLYGYYRELCKVVKAKHSDFDDKKSLYSLRHFWITLQLLAGKVSVYKIARYAGTSLQQIQKHYDSMKDAQISKEILGVNLRFDGENNEIIVLDDDSD